MTASVLPSVQTPFGHACPPAPGHADEHSVTVHMPSWQAVLDFVDFKPELIASIKNMYPRMMPLNSVAQLVGKITQATGAQSGSACLVFPTRLTAEGCKEYAVAPARLETRLKAEDITIHALEIRNCLVYAVVCPGDRRGSIMSYWQTAGVGLSTRYAEYLLKGFETLRIVPIETTPPLRNITAAHGTIKERVAGLIDRAPLHITDRQPISANDVFLYQCGMAAIYHTHRYLHEAQKGTTVLFNFAFHSTPHCLEDFGSAYKFLGKGTEYEELEGFIRSEIDEGRHIQAVWTEFPANPLGICADLSKLRALADKYDFVLVADDTIGSFANVDLFGPSGVDILITSLSKSFSGYADLLAGSAVLNPSGQRYEKLRSVFDTVYTNDLFDLDAEVLEANSRDYLSRQDVLNKNASRLVDHLRKRSQDPTGGIARVWYPSDSETREMYEKQMRPRTDDFEPGHGCVFSIELRTNAITQAWYNCIGNHLHVGPHLGAHLTLVMPYCQILYGKGPGAVEQYRLNERQIRISTGLEDVNTLIAIFDAAEQAGLKADRTAP